MVADGEDLGGATLLAVPESPALFCPAMAACIDPARLISRGRRP